MNLVSTETIRTWRTGNDDWAGAIAGLGNKNVDRDYIADTLGLPLHMAFVLEHEPEATFASIPFYSLCKGLFLPLSGMRPERSAELFGLKTEEPPKALGREKLLSTFFGKEIGLSMIAKLGCVVGDVFLGGKGGTGRDTLVRLLASVYMQSRKELLNDLTKVGDVSVLFARSRKDLQVENALTASEVLLTLQYLGNAGRNLKSDLIRSLLGRCGKLEAYFLSRLLSKRTRFGFEYQGGALAKAIAAHFGLVPEQVAHAMALTDVFHVATVLEADGPEGLRKIQLQPLVGVRPALASGTTNDIKNYPVWVERKYDGIRFMLHKATDETGSMLCAAYTRSRKDWLELVPGLDTVIKMLPCRSCIVDGELYGTVVDIEGPRPATVYEVFAWLQGDRSRHVNLRFASFDLIYIDGHDLTGMPLSQRRQHLMRLVGPMAAMPLAVPLSVADGQMAQNSADVKRLYQHFRAQGHEGVIAKDPEGTYALAQRDKNWTKRKPEITLDLVLLGAFLTVTEKQTSGRFGSYWLGMRTPDGGYAYVGDVAGIDKARDAQMQQQIMQDGLLTGRALEHKSASGTRPGYELRPHIVVTVKFEGIIKDFSAKEGECPYKLRDPKLVYVRSDKTAPEADAIGVLQKLYLKQNVG